MSESGAVSESGESSSGEEESGSGSGEESDYDPSYDYTGEESGGEEEGEEGYGERGEEYSDEEEGGLLVKRQQREDEWQYCEQGTVPRRTEPPQVYAPERGPPLLDFLFVLTAFFAAVFAAYYTIFTQAGHS